MCIRDSLQAINLTSGHGWRYKASTFHKEIGKMIGFNAINIVFALLFDIYFWQNEPDTYSDMVSNMLIDPHENILLASKNRITKVNHSGEIQDVYKRQVLAATLHIPTNRKRTNAFMILDTC